jgi:hypothetical protein
MPVAPAGGSVAGAPDGRSAASRWRQPTPVEQIAENLVVAITRRSAIDDGGIQQSAIASATCPADQRPIAMKIPRRPASADVASKGMNPPQR